MDRDTPEVFDYAVSTVGEIPASGEQGSVVCS